MTQKINRGRCVCVWLRVNVQYLRVSLARMCMFLYVCMRARVLAISLITVLSPGAEGALRFSHTKPTNFPGGEFAGHSSGPNLSSRRHYNLPRHGGETGASSSYYHSVPRSYELSFPCFEETCTVLWDVKSSELHIMFSFWARDLTSVRPQQSGLHQCTEHSNASQP